MASQTTVKNINVEGLQGLVESFMVQIGTKVDVIFAKCLELQDKVEELEEQMAELREWRDAQDARDSKDDDQQVVEQVVEEVVEQEVVEQEHDDRDREDRDVIDLTYSPEVSLVASTVASPVDDSDSSDSEDEDNDDDADDDSKIVSNAATASGSDVTKEELDTIRALEESYLQNQIERALEISAMESNVDEERRRIGIPPLGRVESGLEAPNIQATDSRPIDVDYEVKYQMEDTTDDDVDDDGNMDASPTRSTHSRSVAHSSHHSSHSSEFKYTQAHSLHKSDLPTSGQVVFGEIDDDGWVIWSHEPHFAQLSWDDGVVVETTDANGQSTVYHFAAMCDGVYYPARVHSRYHHADKYTLQLEAANAGDFCMKIIDYVDLEGDSLDEATDEE